jgi:predicted DNA-binding transcriptional regulator AlpA
MGCKTIAEFCRENRISRSMFYKLISSGKAPRLMKIGTSIRISDQAAAEWVLERESESAGEGGAA